MLSDSVVSIILVSSAMIAFCMYITSSAIHSSAQTQEELIFSHGSTPYNKTMADWLVKYWNWTASIPADIHPRSDLSGNACGRNQSGPVWFLDAPIEQGSKTKSTKCIIPENTTIFVPLLMGECDYGDVETKTDNEVSKCAKEGNNGGTIKLNLDGIPVLSFRKTSENDYTSYRILSDFFTINWTSENIYDVDSGPFRARADGYFALFKPLTIGNHIINFDTNVISPISKKYNYHLNMNYQIMIVQSKDLSD